MKFPRFSRPPGHKTAPLLNWNRLRLYLFGLAVLCLAFIAGLYLFFPARALQERVEQEFAARTGATLQIGSLYLGFPPALEAQNLQIAGSRTFDIAALHVRPLWLTLLSNSPGADFNLRLLGGELSGRARRNGALKAKAQQLTFAEKPIPASNIELAGVLGEGTFTGVLPPTTASESRFELRFDSMRLGGLENLGVADGTLNLGQITCRGEGRGNNYRIEQLDATGGELMVAGNGSFMLNQPVQQSRLNLNLSLRPGANMDRNLRDLLALFATPGRDGSFTLRLTGTLATPVFAK